jgi:hypothetical protein
MKSNIIIAGIAISTLMMPGCTKDFGSINKNPNATEQVENPQLLIPSILKTAVRDYFYSAMTRGDIIGDYYANQYVSGYDDAWAPSEVQGYFLWSFYDRLRDVENLINLSRTRQFKNNEGVGLILKAWMFQVMTDIYGDIPFSEAVQGKTGNNFTPKFDSQEQIYYGLLDMLKTANDLLTAGNDRIDGDILLEGKAMRWRMFANGLRLRLMMRMSGKTNLQVDVAKEMQEIAGNPTKYPLYASYVDQTTFNFLDEVNNEFPGYNSVPVNDMHLSLTMEKNLTLLKDPRVSYFALPTIAGLAENKRTYAGVPNGISAAADAAYNGGKDHQSGIGPVLQPLSAFPQASKTAAQGMILTYSEVQFILAEARERNLITTGDAATYYLNGIKDQFAYLSSRIEGKFTFPKASDIQPDAAYYLQPAVKYEGTTQEKLYKIRQQKWLALFNNGFEGWSEWRRTGVPSETKAGPNSAIQEMPRRARYPISEQRLNSTNYSKVIQAQGPDNLITRMWWNK